jgi:hypothetical protein
MDAHAEWDPDDLARLKAERDAADQAYNEALTRLDRAVQRLPSDFPHPPPVPDEQQVTPLNTLWKLDAPPAAAGLRGRFVGLVRRAVAPLFEQQQAFNSALVDHTNRSVVVDRQTREAVASTLAVLREQLAQLATFQSLLVVFLQQVTPYVDTRDRDVAGLLRGLSGAINGVADEMMKRTEALLARDGLREARAASVEKELREISAKLDSLGAALAAMTADRARRE